MKQETVNAKNCGTGNDVKCGNANCNCENCTCGSNCTCANCA